MAEIDISDNIKKAIKYGLPSLIIFAVACASIVWYAMYGLGDVVVQDAKVSSSMVGARTKASGVVTEVMVKDGEQVKAGDVLVRIKVNVTEEQVRQLEQAVELSKHNLEQLQKGVTVTTPKYTAGSAGGGNSGADVERARARMERMKELYDMGAISAVKRDEAIADYNAAVASGASYTPQANVSYETTVQSASPEVIKRAELQVRQAQAALEAAKGNAAATDIVAPVDGTVYIGELAVGDEVQAGQVLADVGNAQSLWIEAYLDQEQQEAARLGQLVSYRVYRTRYDGLVTEIIDPAALQQETANTEGGFASGYPAGKLVVKISIPEDKLGDLKPGEKAEVHFSKKG